MYQHTLECADTRDPYQVMGMPRSASVHDIRRSFRRLAKALHPDINQDDPNAAARFAELNIAHAILSNGDKRRAFDRGEIDGAGRPVRKAMRRRSSGVVYVLASLTIALSMFSVTKLLASSVTIPREVVTNSANPSVPANRTAAIVVAARTPTEQDFPASTFAKQFQSHQINFLVDRGEELVSQGDILAARMLLQRAAEAGDARASFALGGTYDPIMLAILRANIDADVGLASKWYKKARDLGSREAQDRLKVLASLH
jgi:curved DNA-binding protein CbpA